MSYTLGDLVAFSLSQPTVISYLSPSSVGNLGLLLLRYRLGMFTGPFTGGNIGIRKNEKYLENKWIRSSGQMGKFIPKWIMDAGIIDRKAYLKMGKSISDQKSMYKWGMLFIDMFSMFN